MTAGELKSFYSFLRWKGIVKSQKEFAEKIGKSRQYIAEAMNGTEKITTNVADLIRQNFPSEFVEHFETPAKADANTSALPNSVSKELNDLFEMFLTIKKLSDKGIERIEAMQKHVTKPKKSSRVKREEAVAALEAELIAQYRRKHLK